MSNQIRCLVLALLLAAATGCDTPGHRVGASTTVRFGTVQNAEAVTLDSAAAKGAIVGGTLGLMAGTTSSSTFNAAKGAMLGGAAKTVAEGDRSGMAYTVQMQDGTSTRIISDQREIHVGDCVAVEQVGSSANIRRASASYCDPGSAAAVRSVDKSIRTAATACDDAKRELAKASEAEAFDMAARRVELLCNG